jgi:hypothetical protein
MNHSYKVCSMPGCTKTNIAAKGLCHMHYARQRRHGNTDDPEYVNSGKTCKVSGCNDEAKRRGMCYMHAGREDNHGSPTEIIRPRYKEGQECIVPGCGDPVRSKFLCHNHYFNYMYHERKGNCSTVEEYLYIKLKEARQ